MIENLQRQLSDIYRVDRAYDVRDYLITDPTLARILGREALLTNTEETLLVAEDEEGLALSLFLDGDLLSRLHGWLFDNVRYHKELDEEQYERYRSANEYAARFCHRLRRRLVNNAERALGELRDFYRMQLSEKISHIHSRAWAQA